MVNRCYEALILGIIDEALSDMTGMPIERIHLDSFGKNSNSTDKENADKLWATLKQYNKDRCLMGCSISINSNGGNLVVQGNVNTGLFSNHAYGILDIIELETNKKDSRKKISRLLRLRNPYGEDEWQGKWSFNSQEIQTYKKQIEKYNENLEKDEKINLTEENTGSFLIPFSKWRNIFTNLFICLDFPPEWRGVFFNCGWGPKNSIGTIQLPSKKVVQNYGLNPQFILECHMEVEIVLNLSQQDGKMMKVDTLKENFLLKIMSIVIKFLFLNL